MGNEQQIILPCDLQRLLYTERAQQTNERLFDKLIFYFL